MKPARSTMSNCRPPWKLLRMLTTLLVAGLSLAASVAQTTNTAKRLSFDAFRMISDRNIFNPNRYSRSSGQSAPRTTYRPASRVEYFTLVGTLESDRGTYAFFDGTSSDYRKVLRAQDVIGEYQLAAITPQQVKLVEGTNCIDLKLGMQMRREDEGDWFLSEGGDLPPRRVVSTRARTRGSPEGEGEANDEGAMSSENLEPEVILLDSETLTPVESLTAENGGETDPVLLRLMQRREQMNQ